MTGRMTVDRGRIWLAVALVLALSLCILSWMLPALFIAQAPYDIYIPLDAGLRWLAGSLPSRDYPSPIGLLYAVLHGLALSADTTDPRSVVHADTLMLLLTYGLIWPLLRGLDRIASAAILLLLAAMLMTPLALDEIWISYRYVADYNRWCWGLLSVVLVWAWNPAARDRRGQLALGLALCGLFYLKLTVFGGAVGCLVLAWLCERRDRDRRGRDYLLPMVILAVAVLAGLAAGLVLPYLADNIAAAAATGSVRLTKLLTQIVAPYNAAPMALVLLACAIAAIPMRLRLLAVGTTILLQLTALQNYDIMVPVIGLPLLLLAQAIRHTAVPRWQFLLGCLPACCAALGLFLVAATALVLQPAISAAAGAQAVGEPGSLGARILMPAGTGDRSFAAYVPSADNLDFPNAMVYQQIRQAMQLTASLPAGTHVAVLETANIAIAGWPRLKPSPAASLWYDEDRTFSARNYPAPARVFKGADVILVPLRIPRLSTVQLVALYQPWLARCTTELAANDFWRLLQPRQEAGCF